MVRGPSPGPAPASASNSRLTRRVDGRGPRLRRKVQGGWRLHRAAQGAGRPPGAQHIGVVNAVAPSQRRRHQRHHLVARVRPPRGIAQVEALPESCQEARCRASRKEQPGIAVVEGDLDSVGVVRGSIYWVLLFQGLVFCYKTIIPEAQEHLLAARTLTRRLRWIRVRPSQIPPNDRGDFIHRLKVID